MIVQWQGKLKLEKEMKIAKYQASNDVRVICHVFYFLFFLREKLV